MAKDLLFAVIAVAAALAVVLGTNAVVAAAADIMITQVIYDPAGTESGGEAVELYNPATTSVNLSGWVLATETSPTDAILPPAAVICGGCYYLIADSNWSNAKDNGSWPLADFEEAITLANTDAGVALRDANGSAADAAGWGSAANIASGLFEGSPHPGSGSGNALVRKLVNRSYIDTGNNSADFAEAAPFFRNSSYSSPAALQNAEIGITVIVEGSGPAISSFSVVTDDDQFSQGSQVSPVPKSNRTVRAEAVVSDSNGIPDVASVLLLFNSAQMPMQKLSDINATAAVYVASFNLSANFAPGNYSLTVSASDIAGFHSNSTSSFEYLSLAALEVDSSSIVFFAAPGATYEVLGDQSASTAANITVQNSGNVALNFDISATNFTSGSSVIDASQLQYTFDSSYNSSLAGAMANTKARKNVALQPEGRAGLSLRLSVPVATSPGNYTGTVSLVAVKAR